MTKVRFSALLGATMGITGGITGSLNTAAHARQTLLPLNARPPLFALPDANGRLIRLQSRLGSRRIVLVFGADAAFLARVQRRRATWQERDLEVLVIVARRSRTRGRSASPLPRVLLDRHGGVVRAYGAGGKPAFYLVGKDGGIKMAQRTPPSESQLFATIDAMPMRRNEMRRNEMRRNEMRRNEMRRNEMRRNEMRQRQQRR